MTSKNSGLAQLWVLVGLVVMAVALPVASMLVSNNQDNRNKATYSCSEVTNPTNWQQPCAYGWSCNTTTGVWICVPSGATSVPLLPTAVKATITPTLIPTSKPTAIPTQKSGCPGFCTKATQLSCPSESYINNNYYCSGFYGADLGGNCCIRNDGELFSCGDFFGCSVAELGTVKKCFTGGNKKCMPLPRKSGGFCRGWSGCIY